MVAAELLELVAALDAVLAAGRGRAAAAAARGDDQRRRYGQRRRGPCAVFHAYLHWASAPQRLASHSSWVVPQVMPGGLRWEGDTRLSGLLVAESEPDHDGIPGLPDRQPRVPRPARWCLPTRPRLQAGAGPAWTAGTAVAAAVGLPGRRGSRAMTVSPPPGVSASRAVPPLEVTRRCTMARPSPVPFGFEVVKRRKARSRSSALMPGPSSATVIRAPAAVAVAVTDHVARRSARRARWRSGCPGPAPGGPRRSRPAPTRARPGAAGTAGASQGDAAVVGHRVPGHDPLPGHLGHVHRGRHRHHVLRARHREQAVHQPGQPGQLVQRAGQLVPGGLGVGVGSAASRSSRSRSAASGVRSWCDTSAITARFPCTSASSRPAMVLNVVARRRSSGGPGIDHGPDRQVAVGQPAGPRCPARPAACSPSGPARTPAASRRSWRPARDRAEDDPQLEDVAVQRRRWTWPG